MHDWIQLIAHETGHHIAIKALADPHPRMHLGKQKGKEENTLNIHSIFPISGSVAWTDKNTPRWAKFIIHIIGPLCGAAASYLFFVGKNNFEHRDWYLNTDTTSELIINLLPYETDTSQTDGAQALKDIFPRATFKNKMYDILIQGLDLTNTIAICELRATKLQENRQDLYIKEVIKGLSRALMKWIDQLCF